MIKSTLDDVLDETHSTSELGFQLSQCKAKCSNDASCKGFSKYSRNHNGPIICILFTTSNQTNSNQYCSLNFDESTRSSMMAHTNITLGIGALDRSAMCLPSKAYGNYYEGCHIKIKDVKGKNSLHDNPTLLGVICIERM